MDIYQKSLAFHKKHRGKIGLHVKVPLRTREDLSLAYTPGVAEPCREIAKRTDAVWEYTNRRNTVAVVTDGTAVLGLGDIGPEAALPVMEGKAALFKEFADVDAFPICLATKNVDEIVAIVKALEPTFGGINLEDISAPRCFEIEARLQKEMSIPVFHDDQHGTAIVVLAALMNALRVVGKDLAHARMVISGAGAAGIAIAKLLSSQGARKIVLTDSKGIVSPDRTDLNAAKQDALTFINPERQSGSLADAMRGADVFIGVSAPGIVTREMVASMNRGAIVFAMANPVPEIMPEEAQAAGAAVIASGRSDFPNQINNVLAFPGVFRGTLDAGVRQITEEMKIAAATALAEAVAQPQADAIIPDALDTTISKRVAEAVRRAAQQS